MLVIYGNLWQCGHNMQKSMCGKAWRLNGTKWAIIWNSTLGLKPKGGVFPLSLKQGNRGEGAVPHLPPLMVQLQVTPLLLILPAVFLLFLLFLRLPERTCSHTVTRVNLGPFCRDCVHFHRRDTQQLYGSAGGEVGRVRGSPSRGTSTPSAPPTLSQLSAGFHITDKHWQMGSGKWFLHTHVISAIKLVLPSSVHSGPPCVSWEASYQCGEVAEGNANLTWGACTLLFIFCLQWQGICSSEGGRHVS